jgi:putative hemolysin
LLVVSNHPGAYDALILLAAVGRKDAAIVAADRSFLRALPELAAHLILVRELSDAASRALGMRRALRHLAAGGVLIHFGAGRIEVDPAFQGNDARAFLGSWPSGTGALVRGAARAQGVVAAAVVEGVHSERAKRLLVTRLAERRGVTTLAPLLQVALPSYRDVHARVRFSDVVEALPLAVGSSDEQTTARVRSMALSLLGPRPRG